MNKQGFTLIEVLTTVLIIGILAAIAMPMYTRAIERSRATEAMSIIKSINDATYAFFSEKERCPERFSQLVVTLPEGNIGNGCNGTDVICTKHFSFTLKGAAGYPIPGTDGQCMGVLAQRINGGSSYDYTIWNPYTRGNRGEGLALQCDAAASNTKSVAVCESLGLYRGDSSGGSGS